MVEQLLIICDIPPRLGKEISNIIYTIGFLNCKRSLSLEQTV